MLALPPGRGRKPDESLTRVSGYSLIELFDFDKTTTRESSVEMKRARNSTDPAAEGDKGLAF